MSWLTGFLLCITLVWFVGAFVGMVGRKLVKLSLSLSLLGSLIATGFSISVWLGLFHIGDEIVVYIPIDLWKGLSMDYLPKLQLIFGIDVLSAFFVFLVASFSILITIYSFGSLNSEHYRSHRHWIAGVYNLTCWATVLVLLAHDAFTLIITLELMTLSFAYLVFYKYYHIQENPTNFNKQDQYRYKLAPQIYLIFSHSSTVLILLGVIIISINSGSTSFTDWKMHQATWNGISSAISFILIFLGLSIRVGLSPFHVWVPWVHPSLPVNVHAFLSALVIKIPIYLMYRFFFEFMPPHVWWGYLILVIAVVTAFFNVWYALSSHDLKEALAYHSVENIGIISVGIGWGMIFWDSTPSLAFLGLLASIYHLLNHTFFKGLLYLATGAIDNLTHQNVVIDQLGGLIHRYKFTSTMFIIGSFAIAGFPPLNGFISEWLTLKVGIEGLKHFGIIKDVLPFVIILLSLLLLITSFGLTAYCFAKITGVAFLGIPRSPSELEKWESSDVTASMKFGMGVIAISVLLLGIYPGLIAPRLINALRPLGVQEQFDMKIGWNLLMIDRGRVGPLRSLIILPIIVIGIGVMLSLLALLPRLIYKVRDRLVEEPWNCGEPIENLPFQQFSSCGFSYLLRKIFSFLNTSHGNAPEYFPAIMRLSDSKKFPQVTVEIFRLTYNKIIHRVIRFSEYFALWIQNGDIRRYITYIFIVNLTVLILYWLTSGIIGNFIK